MKIIIPPGTTDKSIDIFIQDSSQTDGRGLTGLVYNSSGLTCYYHRPGSAAAQLTLATQTVTGSHSDGGFVEISSSNMPGWYRLDLSDAIIASGVDQVGVCLKGATNMAPCNLEIQLSSVPSNLKQINDNSVVGNVATLTLKQLHIQNSAGTAFLAESTGGNGHGMELIGDGSGHGINIDGGATGNGIDIEGGLHGIQCGGGGAGHGAYFFSGSGATGSGIKCESVATNGHGLEVEGNGTGNGLHALAGLSNAAGILIQGEGTGNGLECVSGTEGGSGIYGKGYMSGHGMELVKGTTGKDIDAGEIDSVAQAVKLEAYVQLLARSDSAIETDRATELAEINADEGSGAGNYSAQTDSNEAIRDNQSGGADWTSTEKANIRHALGVDGTKTEPTGGYGRTGYPLGAVYFDSIAGNTNTVVGVDGTYNNPVSSWSAAKSIADALGSKEVLIVGNMNVDSTCQDYSLKGHRPTGNSGSVKSQITVAAGVTFNGNKLENISFTSSDTSAVGRDNEFKDCRIFGAGCQLAGEYRNCVFNANSALEIREETIILGGSCEPSVPVIYFSVDASTDDLIIAGLKAEQIYLTNITTNNVVSLLDIKGDVTLASSCTGGTINIVGDVNLTDNSSGSTVNLDNQGVKNWNGTPVTTPISVNMTQIGGNSIAGNAATLTLKELNIQNNAGSALTIKSTGGNGHGMDILGNGTGHGINIATGSGSGACGISSVSSASDGHGMKLIGGGDYGYGCYIASTGDADAALYCIAGTNGNGAWFRGGSASGSGMKISGRGGNAVGMLIEGYGSGCGFQAIGGSTNGTGMILNGQGTGRDIDAEEITSRLKKNTAYANFPFVMLNSTTKAPQAGLTVTAERLIDDGAWTACTNSVVEESNGLYRINLAAADLNGDSISLKFTASGALTRIVSIITNI